MAGRSSRETMTTLILAGAWAQANTLPIDLALLSVGYAAGMARRRWARQQTVRSGQTILALCVAGLAFNLPTLPLMLMRGPVSPDRVDFCGR